MCLCVRVFFLYQVQINRNVACAPRYIHDPCVNVARKVNYPWKIRSRWMTLQYINYTVLVRTFFCHLRHMPYLLCQWLGIILPHCFHLHFKCVYKCAKRLIHCMSMTSNENVRRVNLRCSAHRIYEKLPK